MKENSCYDCKDRKVGCHGTCDKYKSWLEEHKKREKCL